MQISLQHNGNHLERRKMYPINHRHNLRSNAELYWLDSLSYERPDNSRVLRHKKEKDYKEIRENYNKYVDQQFSQEFGEKNQYPQRISEEKKIVSTPNSPIYSKTIDVEEYKQDETLTKELENFKKNNHSTLASSRHRSTQKTPQKLTFDSYQQRLYNLRSALDKPAMYEKGNGSKELMFRNRGNDKLEQYLRIGMKKSTRY